MKEQDRKGIAFGFAIAITWLVLLTGIIMYGKIVEGRGATQTIVLPPPPLEVIEIEGVDYGL